MNIFLIGSIAFDEISHFPGRFTDVIRPEKLANLSVCFVVEDKQSFLGGCAGNVAYSLGLLNTPAYICTLVGEDAGNYIGALTGWGMNTDYLTLMSGHTANAFINSDQDENQIAHFAPGVLGQGAPSFDLPDVAEEGDLLLVSPENHDRMLEAVSQGSTKGLRVFFDPGQMVHTFSGDELRHLAGLVDGLFLNRYEWSLFKSISELSEEEVQDKVELVFVTKGAVGTEVFFKGDVRKIPGVKVDHCVGPTGAGDAFRAGVLAALKQGLDPFKAAEIGTILGAASVQNKQTQGHTINEAQVQKLKSLGFQL